MYLLFSLGPLWLLFCVFFLHFSVEFLCLIWLSVPVLNASGWLERLVSKVTGGMLNLTNSLTGINSSFHILVSSPRSELLLLILLWLFNFYFVSSVKFTLLTKWREIIRHCHTVHETTLPPVLCVTSFCLWCAVIGSQPKQRIKADD